MSSKRFDKDLLTAKGYVPDGRGGWVPAKDMIDKHARPKGRGRFSRVKKNDKGMNKTEASYALHLEARKLAGEIHDYWFEQLTLKLTDDTRLTIDFLIQLKDGHLELHDTKGSKFIYQDDAKVKMKVAASMFPFHFVVVYPRTQKLGGGWDLVPVFKD
jgi:hypothetical protein